MKKILFILVLVLLVFQGISQQAIRLHVQPGKLQLAGDGDDYTTLVITARDPEGEVITSMNGKVAVRVSAGFCEAIEVNMQDGVALVKYTSPMFGTPIKASQRMVYFLFKFMQKFIARSAGSTDAAANQKLATEITIESFKEGLIPTTLIPKKDGDNFAYIVCEMDGVKGKAKIEILKATEGRNGNIVQGVYYGRDITGQSDWKLNMYSSGLGTWGEANSSEDDYNTIMFSNEVFTELNDVLGKTAGMTGFLKAYLGPSWKETQYMKDFDIVKMGMGSAYMPMPNNGVFIYVPPILFEYKGRPAATSLGSSASGKPDEVIKTDKSGIILSQNEIIGDGKSRTKAVFHYQDENGVAVGGKAVSWSIPKSIKVISMQTVTDAAGNAETVLEAPVIKATGEKRGDMGGVIDNYDLFQLIVSYSSVKNKTETAMGTLSVFKTLEQNLYILKPGMEPFPYKVLLPQLEYYNLESSVYVNLPKSVLTTESEKLSLNDAIIFVESRKFDKENFQQIYNTWFKKDQKLFMSMLENDKGGYSVKTNNQGQFKLIIRDFEGKMRLATGGYERKMTIEPLQAKIADLTGRRAGALTEVLEMLSAGTDASGNSPQADGAFSVQMVNSLNYKEKVLGQINDMERMLCSGAFTDAMGVEEKLHLIGMLMTNAKGNARFMGDTGKELIGHAWELFKMAWELANEQFKITEGLSKKVGLDKVSDSLAKIGMKIDLGIWSKVTGTDRKTGTKRIIIDFIRKNVLSSDAPNKTQASVGYYRVMGEYGKALSGVVFEQLTEGISDALSDMNPVPDLVVEALKKKYYAGLRGEVDKLLAQSPAKVHEVYARLQPALHDRSTEIRSYYQSVGETRFNTEIYKADWDFFRESVIKGGVISYDLLNMNWHKIKDHLDALEKINKVTDAAYTTTNLALEIYRYHYLWCDARSAFDFVNRSIEQGSVVTTTLAEPEFNFSLFSGAYAAGPVTNTTIPGMAGISGLDFSLQNGGFPVANINKAIDAGVAYNQWIQSDDKRKVLLAGFGPATAGALYKSAYEYENQLTNLLISAMVYAEDKSAFNREAYNASALILKKSAAAFSESSDKAMTEMDKIPENIPVPVFEAEESRIEIWINPLYMKIGGGILLLALVLVLTMIIIRRRRKHTAKTDQPFIQPNIPVVQSPPESSPLTKPVQQAGQYAPEFQVPDIQHPTSDSVTPKFCPQCGAAFKAGAKFCGKCGYKTQ
ncbi:MAG: hypothetical protein Q7U54_09475 [Bacteroidales bacterium]|nr:hypothetical protein [Bacteroidales bacterium]